MPGPPSYNFRRQRRSRPPPSETYTSVEQFMDNDSKYSKYSFYLLVIMFLIMLVSSFYIFFYGLPVRMKV